MVAAVIELAEASRSKSSNSRGYTRNARAESTPPHTHSPICHPFLSSKSPAHNCLRTTPRTLTATSTQQTHITTPTMTPGLHSKGARQERRWTTAGLPVHRSGRCCVPSYRPPLHHPHFSAPVHAIQPALHTKDMGPHTLHLEPPHRAPSHP